ncbi:hypothetical protein D3H65_05660 [Paraflavitalea soli]|uniref:Uncharacterized protein n=1 Tax=Paraflavitalea soli TaxID=2315862 RepID=A0A3B7MGJ9_9BACT|nr:hypothetical protein [Paraflavitalea soli]AXY73494.1 hypothetical protein D3H65_05660 [Paraflavitalea soli]
MKYEKYTDLIIANNNLVYEFTSIGPKGAISKIVQFTLTEDEAIVNLAFGNKKEDGSIDDLARNDNKDMNKILATVVSILKIFFEAYPDKWIFFAGSTPERTRLYRMAITLNYEELIVEYEIVEVLSEGGDFLDVIFEKGRDYVAFLVRKKLIFVI